MEDQNQTGKNGAQKMCAKDLVTKIDENFSWASSHLNPSELKSIIGTGKDGAIKVVIEEDFVNNTKTYNLPGLTHKGAPVSFGTKE